MTREDIIRMAREADVPGPTVWSDDEQCAVLSPHLAKFADLVAAAEREACARVCEQHSMIQLDERVMRGIDHCVEVIRARGQT